MLRIQQQQPEQWQVRPFGLNPVELEKALRSEEAALRCITAHKWPGGRVQCRHCGSDNTRRPVKDTTNERYQPRYVCRDCGNKSTAISGTAIPASDIPLSLWMRAIAAYVYQRPTPNRPPALRHHVPQLTEPEASEILTAIVEAERENRRVYETIQEANRRRPPRPVTATPVTTLTNIQGKRPRATPAPPVQKRDEVEAIIAQLEERRDRLKREIELKSHELAVITPPLATVIRAKSLLANWKPAGAAATRCGAHADMPPADVV